MQERLRTRDLPFLATESPSTPMHNATLEIFDPKDSGFDYHFVKPTDPREIQRAIEHGRPAERAAGQSQSSS